MHHLHSPARWLGACILFLAACGDEAATDADTADTSEVPDDDIADGDAADGDATEPPSGPPNILFVIMDDVGVDQMAAFGYGGAAGPLVPVIDAVTEAGVRFRNAWSMPECSPGRAAFLVGRLPLRTDMRQALGPNDLANSQLSPYDVTVPRLLARAGYESALFGKFHLAGPDHNAAGQATPSALGWDHFYGWIGGLPASVDTTAGGVAPVGTHTCGFVATHAAGACHFADGTCEELPAAALTEDANGLACLTAGGIFVADLACADPLPAELTLTFDKENAYYVSPLVIIDGDEVTEVPLTDPRARRYRTTIETDAAIAWIRARQAGDRPWMATVAYSAAHTPWQTAPSALTPTSRPRLAGDQLDCTSPIGGRVIQDQMTEAMDTELGRLLVETGLASRDGDGALVYSPEASDTVIVIVGDNGTLGGAVKLPFDPQRAKGTSYQTGVWVPLVVAGPDVAEPGRAVEHMVNAVDVFQLFGELAGLDVHAEVPRTLDSVSMLPYLSAPEQGSLRAYNFAQSGMNAQLGGGTNGPCVLGRTDDDGGACTQIPTQKSVCEDNGGVWWGPAYTDAGVVDNGGVGYPRCWTVNQAILTADPGANPVAILPEWSVAVRDPAYKLVRNTTTVYDVASDGPLDRVSTELYAIDAASPVPALDRVDADLLTGALDAGAQAAYDELLAKLEAFLASEPPCPGDGNRDGVVDATDLSEWEAIATGWGRSSVYDFTLDGLTDGDDRQIIEAHLGDTCPATYGVY